MSATALLLFVTIASAVERELAELSLEDLMNLEVTSVSKVPERRSETAAALAVITGEDIRRSGATSLPAALSMAPGLHVAQLDSSGWSVSSRGFASANSGPLLVLIDGRSIYTPLFSGVFWDAQDLLLEDVDRIEVIRGPGGSLWGANAMNGVINVVSRNARDTQGIFAEAGGGTEERAFGAVRYGGSVGDGFHYRVYGKYFDRDESANPFGPDDDDWRAGRAGFRSDWSPTADDVITFQGELYRGEAGQLFPSIEITGGEEPRRPLEVDFAGGNVLGSWHHAFSEDSGVETRLYYDRTHRDDPTFRDDLDTIDLDVLFKLPPVARHQLLWGVAYRVMMDDFRGKTVADLRPGRSTDQLVSGFVQDQFPLVEDLLQVTLGTKLEYNEFSGFEVQPTARMLATPAPLHTLWGAVSRAVRVPTRIERDVFAQAFDAEGGFLLRLLGSKGLESEKMTAFEIGYRVEPTDALFLDFAAFYNVYESVITLEIAEPTEDADGRPVQPVFDVNGIQGDAYGGEASATWVPWRRSRIVASYSYLRFTLEPEPGASDVGGIESVEDDSPDHQIDLRIFNDLPAGFAADFVVRYVDNVGSGPEIGLDRVGSYVNFGARLAWTATSGLELSLVGQNLVENEHREFPFGSGIERGVYGKVAWRY